MTDGFRSDAETGFAQAWFDCCEATEGAVMPEATFQAWFAHSLMDRFPMRCVAREPDFDPRHSRSEHAVGFDTSVHLDIVVCTHPAVELPRRAARTTGGPGGWDSLRDLAIISEIKVGSTTLSGFSYSAVAQDYRKLSMFLDEAQTRGLEPPAFMCLLDNHPTRRVNPRMIRKRIIGCRPEIRTLWWSIHGTSWEDGW